MRVAVAPAVACAAVVLVPAGATPPDAQPRLAAPPSATVQYGYVRSVTRAGAAFRLRFDPALWLTGETAIRAAAEDGLIEPGETVPNDYYIRNESRRQLTYVLPAGARITVVALRGGNPHSTRISAARLATIARGGTAGLRLYGRNLGYWARVVGDRVIRLDQQYQP